MRDDDRCRAERRGDGDDRLGCFGFRQAQVDIHAGEHSDDAQATTESPAATLKSHSYYVDLRAAFKGPDYACDETRYLAGDGDHPNAAGHRQIAKAVEAVVGSASR